VSRKGAIVLLASFAALVVVAVVVTGPVLGEQAAHRTIGYGQIRFDGAGPERWARRARLARRQVGHLRAQLVVLRRRLRDARNRALLQVVHDPRTAIAVVFGPYAGQALAVSSCETGGTYSTAAANGQYLGIFQMGSHERATYGQGSTALAQALAAYVYFVITGRDWSPWSCRP